MIHFTHFNQSFIELFNLLPLWVSAHPILVVISVIIGAGGLWYTPLRRFLKKVALRKLDHHLNIVLPFEEK
jgi:hypothetical protein